jgi:hypothetical protein
MVGSCYSLYVQSFTFMKGEQSENEARISTTPEPDMSDKEVQHLPLEHHSPA